MSGIRRLTDVDAMQIRDAYRDSGLTLGQLAELYGVSHVAIWRVIHERTYKKDYPARM